VSGAANGNGHVEPGNGGRGDEVAPPTL
jgi:hypothetical protein